MIAGQLLAGSFQRLLTGSNRLWQPSSTDTPIKMSSKSFTIWLTLAGLLMWLSLGPALQHLQTSILGIECTPSMVDALARLGLDILYAMRLIFTSFANFTIGRARLYHLGHQFDCSEFNRLK